MGEPSFLSEEFATNVKADPDIELVSTSGHGKNGALCVLQQTVRPSIITSFPLAGCNNMWTLVGPSKVKEGHAFLILSLAESSTSTNRLMILQTGGDEINDLEVSGFCTNLPTIYTGNIGENRFIVQLCTTEARLLKFPNVSAPSQVWPLAQFFSASFFMKTH